MSVTRMDYDRVRGYWARRSINGEVVGKLFSASKCGGMRRAKEMAEKHDRKLARMQRRAARES